MFDRIPSPGKEGRMLIMPENGEPFYATVVMADDPVHPGTELSKATLLSDKSAEQFDLGPNAEPNDVFHWMGRYNRHWWSLVAARVEYDLTDSVPQDYVAFYNDPAKPVYCADSVSLNQATGTIELINPVYLDPSNFKNLPGKKFFKSEAGALSLFNAGVPVKILTNEVVYFDTPVLWTTDGNYTIYNPSSCKISESVRHEIVMGGPPEYLFSDNPNAYEDGSIVNGRLCRYMGRPFERFAAMPQVATGNYVGTGEYGKDYYTELHVGFDPVFMFIAAEDQAVFYKDGQPASLQFFVWTKGMTQAPVYIHNGVTMLEPDVKDGVFRFREYNYSGASSYNYGGLNYLGKGYRWFALGFASI